MLFKKRRKKVIHHSDRRRHFIFVLVSCICLLHSIWNWRQEKYKRRAWQIGLAVQTRTIVIINGCYSINTPLYAAQTATAADYSSRVTGRYTSFIHSFIQLWWNGKTFYCRLLIGIVDPWHSIAAKWANAVHFLYILCQPHPHIDSTIITL